MIGAGGWGVGVELFWAAASFRVDDGFDGEVQLSAVWPARTSRGITRERTGHARGALMCPEAQSSKFCTLPTIACVSYEF